MQDSDHVPPGCIAAILPAGGSGQRFGAARNKLFSLIDGKPVWYHAAARLRSRAAVGRIVMSIAAEDRRAFEGEFADRIKELHIDIVLGGKERTDSVRNALDSLTADNSIRYVAVHDAARPLVPIEDLDAVFASAVENDAAMLATPMPGSVKRGNEHHHVTTVDRRDLWIALTPQVFLREFITEAYAKYRGRPATDDAELVERIGHRVTLVHGSAANIKITLPEDLAIAEAILQRQDHHA